MNSKATHLTIKVAQEGVPLCCCMVSDLHNFCYSLFLGRIMLNVVMFMLSRAFLYDKDVG